jgi:predicted RNase H-like HicB family nuclease
MICIPENADRVFALDRGWQNAVLFRKRHLSMRYTVFLEQEADGGFVVTVPALPACVSQGDTREEALANIREAIQVYIEHLRERGEEIPREADTASVELDDRKFGT